MALIDITTVLSQDLTSRESARRLMRSIPAEDDVVFDFRNVKFAKTQNRVKTVPETAHVKSFSTVDEFCQYMSGVEF